MTATHLHSTGPRPRPRRDIVRLARQLACLGLCWLGLAAQAAAQIRINVDDASGVEGTGANTEMPVRVWLTGPAGPGGVQFGIAPGIGTAMQLDYVAGVRNYEIPEGETETTAFIPIVGDALDEPDETFGIRITSYTGAANGILYATGTIIDDDEPPVATVVGSPWAQERDPGSPEVGLTFRVMLDAPSGRVVSIDWSTQDGSATAGADYLAASGTVVFQPGQTEQLIGSRMFHDFEPEAEEDLFVVLSNPVNATLGNPDRGRATIRDDDYYPQVSIDDPSVTEGDDAAVDLVYTVSLDRPGKLDVILSYATVVGGSASFQTDYADTRGSIVIPVGETSATITVPVLPDVLVENDETVHVELGYPFDAEIIKARGTGTIIDNDVPLALAPDALPATRVGEAYSVQLAATGGDAPYRFRLAGGTLPAGITLAEDGTLSGTATDGGGFGFNVAVEDSFGNGPRTGNRNYVLTVERPDVLAPAQLPQARYGDAYDASLPLAGTAPFNVTLTSGSLPIGMQLGSDGRITGSTVQVGSFDFTAGATDSSGGTGPYADSQAYTLVVLNIAPVAEDISTSVPYNAGPTTVPALSSGGRVSDFIVASQPANGVATGGPGGLRYAPNPGFSGTDSFQYQLGNEIGISAPATMTILVEAPVIVASDGGPADAVVGQPYSRTITFSGGAAPYRNLVASGLPQGLQASLSGDDTVLVSGTPSEAGQFSLQISVEDSSTGDGPFPGSVQLDLAVASPGLALSPVQGSTFAARYNSVVDLPFVASGGVGPYRYEVSGDLPAGLALNGDRLGGTPTDSGRFGFTVTATDEGSTGAGAPFTVSADYVLEVEGATITLSPGDLPDATAGEDYAAALSADGGVAPYTFALVDGTLPAGLVLAADGGLSGVPTEAGEFRVTVRAEDANGQRGERELVLQVEATAVTAVSRTVPVLGGTSVSVELGAGATGGPITGASLVSLSPADAGTATVVARDGGWYLDFTADGAFGGDAVATFTLSSAYATSAPATITFQVQARPDPSADPQVRALLDAQVSASRRFGEAQVGNFQQRLSQLHRGDTGGFSNGLAFAAQGGDDCLAPVLASQAHAIACAMGLAPRANPGADGGAGAATGGDWGTWIAGSLRTGRQDGQAGELDFESDGLSLGVDRRIREDLVIGVGLGWGRDDNEVGDEGSRLDGESQALAVYASWHPGERGFLDVVLGRQSLEFDLRRYVTATGGLVSGRREGDQWFASLSAGAAFDSGALRTTPYARLDVLRTELDAYTETGDPVWALAYGPMDIEHTVLSGGVRFEGFRDLGWATLAPQLRIEYQRLLEGRGEGWLRYADLPGGTAFNAVGLESDRNRLVLGLGARLATEAGWMWQLELGGELDGDGQSTTGVNLGVQKQF